MLQQLKGIVVMSCYLIKIDKDSLLDDIHSVCIFSIQKYIIQQVKPMVEKLGWKDEGPHLSK